MYEYEIREILFITLLGKVFMTAVCVVDNNVVDINDKTLWSILLTIIMFRIQRMIAKKRRW